MLVTRIWRDQPGEYFFISHKSRKGTWHDEPFKRSQFKKVKAYIEKNLDKDLYFCPHGFIKPRRLKDYAELPNLLWADLDEVNPSKIKPMPTIAWQSSPGRWQALWIVDKTISESINRRLTYMLGADLGGWDLTQVLRIPGTSNYKYASTPPVKVEWSDGHAYALEEIEKILPAEKDDTPNLGEALKIYKRYEKALPAFVRRELLNGKPKRGKRSEVLWRLNKEMLESGMTSEEVFSLLVVSPWNKFAGRRNGAKQLRRELDKAVQQKLESKPVEDPEDYKDLKFFSIGMDQVEEKKIDWVWYPYLARGEITILEGDPGLGKSYLAQVLGIAIADGKKLPSVKALKAVKGKVCYFDLENDAGSVTKRRLIDNGCEHLEHYYQEETFFRIDDEDSLDAVYEAIERIRPDMVVFDTLNTYIGKVDTHKASETQQALATFKDLARRFRCSVVVVRHLTKSTKERALYRGQGSIGFTGMARVVMTVGQHPEEADERVLAVTKVNVTKRPPALTYRIIELSDTLRYQDRSALEWGEFVELTSDEIVSVGPVKKPTKTDEVVEFLNEFLNDGPQELSAVKRAAEARSISNTTLMRTAKTMGIIKEKTGFGKKKKSTWALPGHTDETHSEHT